MRSSRERLNESFLLTVLTLSSSLRIGGGQMFFEWKIGQMTAEKIAKVARLKVTPAWLLCSPAGERERQLYEEHPRYFTLLRFKYVVQLHN